MIKYLLIGMLLMPSYAMAGWQYSDKKVPDQESFINTESGSTIKVYTWYPDNYGSDKEYNAVVMAHGCGGAHYKDEPDKWTSKYISGKYKVWGKLLSDKNLVVILVDSFTTRDEGGDVGGGVCSSSDSLARPTKIDPVSVRPADIAHAIKYLRENGDIAINKVGVLGFSNGGTSALVLANHKDLERRNKELAYEGKIWFDISFIREYQADLIVSMYPGCALNGYSQETQGIFYEQFSTYTDTFLIAASDDTSLPDNTKEKCKNLRVLDAYSSFENSNMKTKVVENTNHQFDYKEIDEAPVEDAVKSIISLFESM